MSPSSPLTWRKVISQVSLTLSSLLPRRQLSSARKQTVTASSKHFWYAVIFHRKVCSNMGFQIVRSWELTIRSTELCSMHQQIWLEQKIIFNYHADEYVITLSRSLVVPFLTFSDRRDLRETAWWVLFTTALCMSHSATVSLTIGSFVLSIMIIWAQNTTIIFLLKWFTILCVGGRGLREAS